MLHFRAFLSLLALPCLAATPGACVSSQPLGTFKISVSPAQGGTVLPLREVNALHKGQFLLYDPVHIPAIVKDKAEIAVLLAPAANSKAPLQVLNPEPAAKPGVWVLPRDASVVALVYAPQGLSMRKVKALMERNDEVLAQLADYADQTSHVSALIQELQDSENSGLSVSAALAGFATKSGVTVPQLDPHTATGDQAATLLGALSPSMNSMDPLTASNTAVVTQSAGLATAVAGLFLGNPVGIVAGGASLFQNMHAMLFPETEFQSIIAQTAPKGAFSLCAKTVTAKPRTRLAYLWAHRLPELAQPKLSLAASTHLPIGAKSLVALHADDAKTIALLRNWQLAPAQGGPPIPVPATLEKNGEIQLDLSKTKAAPGDYRLQASWDWDEVSVSGNIHLRPYSDLKLTKLSADSRARLVQGSGPVPLKLEGADFEFLEKAAIERAGPHPGKPLNVSFTLPEGPQSVEQPLLEAELDTNALKPGPYRLLLAQTDGVSHPVPVTILPPNPKLEDLPLRINTGEASQKLMLHGAGLDRIESLTTEAGEIDLSPPTAPSSRQAVVKLNAKAASGQHFALSMKVEGLESPLLLAGALQIRGPRPRISAVRTSYPQSFALALNTGEIPAAVTASFSLAVANAGESPSLDVSCSEAGPLRHRLHLAAGDRDGGARLDLAGEGALFLSLDPGAVGRSGCQLEARVTSSEGASDPYRLGRILRVPRIEQFSLTDQKLADGNYTGTLKGEDLDTIEQTGWDPQHGFPVQSIPEAAPDSPQKELLKIEVPWPAPAPHAPVFVWLRGEPAGRPTGVKY